MLWDGEGGNLSSLLETFKLKPQGFNQEECSKEGFQAAEISTPSSSAQRFKFHQQNQPGGEIIDVLCF